MKLRRFATTSVLGIALLGIFLPLRGFVAEIITTNIYLVTEDQVEDEDVYVASTSARVAGIIDGDLVVSTGNLTISGVVTGDVFVLTHGKVHVTGEIGGSLRGTVREVIVEGTVGDDVIVAAVTTRISGTVMRDALVFGGSLTVDGEVKRNVNGRMLSAVIDGKVGNDVDIAVGNLTLGQAAVVDGDVLYRSGSDAEIAATAQVASQLERLPTRGSFSIELVLTVATILGFFAFLFAGFVLLWLFRGTAPRAVATIEHRPLRAAAVGAGAILVLPVLVVVLAMTLVGVPVAVALLVLLLLALVLGPVPAVTALGSRLLRRRHWGLFASFAAGALIWRLGIRLIPIVGFGLYLGALAAGFGGWLIAIWEQRRETVPEQGLLPVTAVPAGGIPSPVGWDAPLAPGTRREEEEEADKQQEPGGDG
jgi:hypothetical protein